MSGAVGTILVLVAVWIGFCVGREFPASFRFGTASAAYQIEGFNSADGKGASIWDDFTKIPGKVIDSSSGDDGPDSYKNYKEDVKLIKVAGLQFYRFSISWPRVMSDGTRPSKNEAGLQYYDNLINELIANDIEPVVTMYHWDMPSRIHDLGGFTSPMFPLYFEEYASLLFERFGDRVKQWITFNEPNIYCNLGYATGEFAPGFKVSGGEYYCIYYTQLAHARVYHLYNERFRATQGGRVGITFMSYGYFPKNPSNPSDVQAAERMYEFGLGVYAQPIMTGDFPEVVKEYVDRNSAEEGQAWSRLPVYDKETIDYVKGTTDFFGLNYYTSYLVTAADSPNALPNIVDDPRVELSSDPTWPQASVFWLFSVPEGLHDVLVWIKERYNSPEIIITENGWADDEEFEDGDRVEYLRLHLNAVLDAIDQGVKVTGHTTWSVVDVFEWASGYTVKFGIHSVDRLTKARTAKKSVSFLKELTSTRVLPEKVPTKLFP